ncbi:MAG: ATP-binding cassette domain-containing protein, partial [Actinomycetota bacterium]
MIELKDVSFRYRGTERPALNRVNLKFDSGEFALICGATGSGKSTLLRIMNSLAPHFTGGELSGQLLVEGDDCTGKLPHDLATKIGFVNQQPESSFVTDTVREELAFGMEQLGFDRNSMISSIKNVSEMLGIQDLLDRPLSWLSGGQQQRVAIAAALAAGAKILLLDEPTSALDPNAAQEVVHDLWRLSKEKGITVILVEHKIERVVALVDSIVIVGNDGLVTKGGREQFAQYRQLPPLIALANKLSWPDYPLSTAEARKMWSENPGKVTPRKQRPSRGKIALEVKDVSVRYSEQLALYPTSFELAKGEITALMGPNGSGKSSLLWSIQGTGDRGSGSVFSEHGDPKNLSPAERLCVISMVPQKASDLLFAATVSEELAESDRFSHLDRGSTGRIFENL